MQIVIEGLLTNYKDLGDKNKQCLLVLHGWKNSLIQWENIAQCLADTNRVILLDLPGFGGTVQPKTTFDIYDYANFVNKFLEKLKISQYSVLGHSFGGRISIILAAKNSSKINKLILVDSAGTEVISTLYKSTLSLLSPVIKVLPENILDKARSKIGSKDYLNAGTMSEIFKKVIAEDLTPLLKDISAPTIIIWGDKDKTLDVSITKLFKKEIPNSLIRIVWGAGHHPYLENESVFVEILKDFLND